MFTLIYMMLIIPGIVDKTASITRASSDISEIENSIQKTDISISGLSRPGNPQFQFDITNLGNEKLWNYDKFTIMISYVDVLANQQVRVLPYNGLCGGGFPPNNTWCAQTITGDIIDPGILNTNEVLTARITVDPESDLGTVTVVVSTDNGVVSSQTVVF